MDRMKAFIIFFVASLFILIQSAYAFNTDPSPIGYWRTIDDVTGKPKSIIQIWKNEDQTLAGKVVKIFSSQAKNKLCVACKGLHHNEPIVGMVILSQLKPGKARWKDGQILDPQSGKTYRCSLQVAEKGNKLNVHGYIGLPMFGRSQIWERVDLMSA